SGCVGLTGPSFSASMVSCCGWWLPTIRLVSSRSGWRNIQSAPGGTGSARAALERRTIHVPDVRADPEYTYGAKDVEAIRTILGVPILKGDSLLGVMMIYRLEVKPFTDKQISLVETFADQAAIAIQNV